MNGARIIYDGDCPFCSSYIAMVRLREAVGPVTLINARNAPDEVAALVAQGFDLDEGMVLIMDGQIYHGVDCIHRIALLTSPSTWLNRVNRAIFRSRTASRLLYPILKRGRALTLRLLGRRKISAAPAN